MRPVSRFVEPVRYVPYWCLTSLLRLVLAQFTRLLPAGLVVARLSPRNVMCVMLLRLRIVASYFSHRKEGNKVGRYVVERERACPIGGLLPTRPRKQKAWWEEGLPEDDQRLGLLWGRVLYGDLPRAAISRTRVARGSRFQA